LLALCSVRQHRLSTQQHTSPISIIAVLQQSTAIRQLDDGSPTWELWPKNAAAALDICRLITRLGYDVRALVSRNLHAPEVADIYIDEYTTRFAAVTEPDLIIQQLFPDPPPCIRMFAGASLNWGGKFIREKGWVRKPAELTDGETRFSD